MTFLITLFKDVLNDVTLFLKMFVERSESFFLILIVLILQVQRKMVQVFPENQGTLTEGEGSVQLTSLH
jgi:hypothetical protein